MPEYVYLDAQQEETAPDGAVQRVPLAIYTKFKASRARLAALRAQLDVVGDKPLVVAPEQEEVMRAACRPGTWIVVRSVKDPMPAAEPLGDPPEPLGDPPQDTEPAIPRRPPLGTCPQRRGMAHLAERWLQTAEQSVYFPGLKRVDGLCRCGLRIADVKCPHQKQLPDAKTPTCAWCGRVLISGAGFNENWDAQRGRMTKPPTLVTTGRSQDEQTALNATAPFRGGA